MDKSAAESYVYAKACGLLGKAFINERASLLFSAKSLGELWSVIFKTQAPLIPEVLLAQKIEADAFSIFINQYLYFVNQFDNPDKILMVPLKQYDAENLKVIGAALCSGENECPALIDLGKFSKLNYKAWPEIMKITEGTEFSWYNKVPSIHEQQKLEFKLDLQNLKDEWAAIQKTHGDDKRILTRLFETEYIIKNIVWALRLKINYGMDKEKIIENLIHVTESPSKMDPIAAPAIAILDKEVDVYEQWTDWKYAGFLNPHVAGEVWSVDPAWIEKKGRLKINQISMWAFHQNPMSVSSLIGWYKIKNFELSCIRTAVESLRLGIAAQEAMGACGIGEK